MGNPRAESLAQDETDEIRMTMFALSELSIREVFAQEPNTGDGERLPIEKVTVNLGGGASTHSPPKCRPQDQAEVSSPTIAAKQMIMMDKELRRAASARGEQAPYRGAPVHEWRKPEKRTQKQAKSTQRTPTKPAKKGRSRKKTPSASGSQGVVICVGDTKRAPHQVHIDDYCVTSCHTCSAHRLGDTSCPYQDV